MNVQPTPVDLSGVLLKLAWAEKHIETFRQTIEAYEARDPRPLDVRIEGQQLDDGSEEYELYAIVREQPPQELALIVGDVVHNVRSALDHLVYALSSPEAQESRDTQFPIFTERGAFERRGVSMIESITGPERTLIENVQPFAHSVEPDNDPLEILRRLSNMDKHRLPVPTVTALQEQATWVATDNADLHFTSVAREAVQDGDPIVTITARPQDPSKPMIVQPKSGPQVQMSESGWVNEMDALSVLHMIHQHVRYTVIGRWSEYRNMPMTLAELHPDADGAG
jgi:hypothetical protein